MDKKMMYAIIGIVVVVVIIGVAAIILTNDDSDDNSDDNKTTSTDYLTEKSGTATVDSIDTKLLVFGNANNDVYLNGDDVDFIQKIVDGNATWDSKANPLADTNADGSITVEDVNLLKAIIAGKEAPMFYLNSNLETVKIQFPLTGNISISQTIDADMLKICGKYDMITAWAGNDTKDIDTSVYTGADKWKCVGSYPYDYEKVVAAGVDITLGQPYDYDDTFDKLVKNGYSNYRLDTVKLHEGRFMNSVDSVACTVTLGALLNSFNDPTYKKYLDFANSVEETISSATSNVAEYPTYIMALTHATSSAASMGIDNDTTAVENYLDAAMVNNLKMKAAYPVGPKSYMRDISVEKLLDCNPDVIFVDETNGSKTHDEYVSNVNNVAQYFISAGYTGKIIGIHWSVAGSATSTAALSLLASFIYDDNKTGSDEGWNALVDYLNTFMGLNYTSTTVKDSIYAPFVVQRY